MLWEQIAAHFQGRGPRLVFELYNEPHGRMNGEPWNVLAARALRVVRRTNPDRIVVIGPTSWNSASDLRLLKMPNDANLIATVHNYNPVPVHASGRRVGDARHADRRDLLQRGAGGGDDGAARRREGVVDDDALSGVRRRVRRVQQGRLDIALRLRSQDAPGDGVSAA